VNILSPGTIDTPVFEKFGIPEDIAMDLNNMSVPPTSFSA